ncbi:hypothetical protein F5Y17DRAFT_456119 [Xylariaceae sp. FL0594]|nr:hypothetical protein F5Y17DRAFT_456119 [Xylariaceae sp. FL0594]
MPTPSASALNQPQALPRTHSSSCPEDTSAPGSWRPDEDVLDASTSSPASATSDTIESLGEPRSVTESSQSTSSPTITDRGGSEETGAELSMYKPVEGDLGETTVGWDAAAAAAAARTRRRHVTWCDLEPGTTEADRLDHDDPQATLERDAYESPMGLDRTNVRIYPTSSSSFLRAGSKFIGTQQSERQVYDVQVELKYVDLRQSYLCGYLKIQGLTEENPTLTTYFQGEIIGSRYDFVTRHKDWGATKEDDLSHWSKFSAFRKYHKYLKSGTKVTIPNLGQQENIFMRWKEHFLVPDHRVTSLTGASFEGFYYICFNQKEGSISGIYFHAKSEKFQQLELKHVEDKGCFSAIEYR